MLADKKCADLANGILQRLGSKDDALTSFNKVKSFYATSLSADKAWGLGGGLISNGTASIGIELLKGNETAYVFHSALARTLYHEIVHVATGAGHPAMAQAAYDTLIAQGYKNVGKPPAPGVDDYDFKSSQYFEGRIFDVCKKK
jgi:hypothetical protein